MKKVKNLKPTDIDLYIKYTCPNKSCKNDHWTTLKESQTKNFIIVCDCDYIIKPKQIDTIKIKYTEKKKNSSQETSQIPQDLLQKSLKIMVGLGYSESESSKMIIGYYKHNPINDYMTLVKNTIAISNIGESNE